MIRLLVKIIVYPFLRIMYPVKIIGKKNIIKKQKMIFIANHQTNHDPVILWHRLPNNVSYMAKKPLFEKKFNNWALLKFGAFPVDNKSNDLSAIKKSLAILKNDKALCMFPEGSRFKGGELQSLKGGLTMFALKTNAPIVPSYFIGQPGFFKKCTLVIGQPFTLAEMPQFKDQKMTKELMAQANDIVSEKMKECSRMLTVTTKK